MERAMVLPGSVSKEFVTLQHLKINHLCMAQLLLDPPKSEPSFALELVCSPIVSEA